MVLEFNPLGCSNACVKGWVRVIILTVGYFFVNKVMKSDIGMTKE